MGFRTFEDLEVYKKARELRKMVYQLINQLPKEEKYNLAGQMRRAALSLTNNIAEGYGRYHFQENIQYLRQSRGSLEELMDDLNCCHDEKYFNEDQLEQIREMGINVRMFLNGYIKYLRQRKTEIIK